MRLFLVTPSGGNLFTREILDAIAFEAEQLGISAAVVEDTFPDDDDAIYVVIPQEFFVLVAPDRWPTSTQLGRTFALTVEHPGTLWFEASAEQARRCAAIIDINQDSTAELRRRGLPVEHFQLGYTEYFDDWRGEPGLRSTDIVYLGAVDDRRDRILAGAAPLWWDRNVKLLLPANVPRTSNKADFVAGPRKWELLRDSRVLVNLHRANSRSFEWVRVLEAVANGCVVFSEHSLDAAPFIPGEHFVSASPASLGVLVADALYDDKRLAGIRQCAYDFVRSELRLSSAVELLLERAEGLLRKPATVPAAEDLTVLSPPEKLAPAWQRDGSSADRESGATIARLEERIHALTSAFEKVSDHAPVIESDSESYSAARPRVSVIVPMYNAASWIADCLDSVRASRDVEVEVLVCDDGSTDDSVLHVLNYQRDHPSLPLRLIRSKLNRGIGVTRNVLVRHARGEFVFALDADNGVYPSAISRLVSALDEDQDAAFAYSIIALFWKGQPQGLVSSRPWNPRLFRQGNYIDNMALLRTDRLRDLGGWNESLSSWEDFELWLRYAQAGERAAFIPAVLSWYRMVEGSTSWATYRPRLWPALRAAAPSILTDE